MPPEKSHYRVTLHINGTDFDFPFEEVPFVRDEDPDIKPTDDIKDACDQLYAVYQGLVDAGFSETQAFQLMRDILKKAEAKHAAED